MVNMQRRSWGYDDSLPYRERVLQAAEEYLHGEGHGYTALMARLAKKYHINYRILSDTLYTGKDLDGMIMRAVEDALNGQGEQWAAEGEGSWEIKTLGY